MSNCEQKNYQNQDLQDERMNLITSQNHNPANQEILKIMVQTNKQMSQSKQLDTDIKNNLKLLGYE